MTRILPKVSAGLALLLGSLFGMMLAGVGPCAARLSVGSIGGALAAGIIVSWLGAVFLQTRWLAALLFSLPMALVVLVPAISYQWWRCFALLACIVVPFAVVGLFRFDHRKVHGNAA
jgi:uncharacterized membrane protein